MMLTLGWRRARNAIGLHVCVPPSDPDDIVPGDERTTASTDGGANRKDLLSPVVTSAPVSPRFPSRLHLLRSSLRCSKTTCAICLEVMKPGRGHALFTAECSHSFHFSCIASNVRHGNLVCPVCRATWAEVPWQAPSMRSRDKIRRDVVQRSSSASPRRAERSGEQLREALREAEEEQRRLEPVLRMLDESIASFRAGEQGQKLEPATFDDDEALEGGGGEGVAEEGLGEGAAVQISTCLEESVVAFSEARERLTVLVNVKAAAAVLGGGGRRAAVDLVTVLDVSASMAAKLPLLKRAMALVARSLGPADRLSVVAFASAARRVTPLQRMTDAGRRAALQAIDALGCSGGTDIAQGLRKGSAVLQQRRHRNPVATIMLLSDGQDTHTMRPPPAVDPATRYGHVPVHAFGLGADHDAGTMHSISEESGGTFSFVQSEGLVQDAFAQCIGGLLSVVALRVEVEVSVVAPSGAELLRLDAGSYASRTLAPARHALVQLGDLYAHEERDFLVDLRLPALPCPPSSSTELLHVRARYHHPVSGVVLHTSAARVHVPRPCPSSCPLPAPCIHVDRHRNRLRAAHAISEARSLADSGDLPAAQRTLDLARQHLQRSPALHSGDTLSTALDAELARIQVRMRSRQLYETCGRAYALSAQSSHLRQRATTRSTEASDAYRTPSMNTMLLRSQAFAPSCVPNEDRRLPPLSSTPRRRHILEPRPGSRLARLASFDSTMKP